MNLQIHNLLYNSWFKHRIHYFNMCDLSLPKGFFKYIYIYTFFFNTFTKCSFISLWNVGPTLDPCTSEVLATRVVNRVEPDCWSLYCIYYLHTLLSVAFFKLTGSCLSHLPKSWEKFILGHAHFTSPASSPIVAWSCQTSICMSFYGLCLPCWSELLPVWM